MCERHSVFAAITLTFAALAAPGCAAESDVDVDEEEGTSAESAYSVQAHNRLADRFHSNVQNIYSGRRQYCTAQQSGSTYASRRTDVDDKSCATYTPPGYQVSFQNVDPCEYLSPLRSMIDGGRKLVLTRGVYASGGIGIIGAVGAEAVYDLWNLRGAGFVYSGMGMGNILGLEAGGYMGAAFVSNSVLTNISTGWEGPFGALTGSISVPGTKLGVFAQYFWAIDPETSQNAGTVYGGAMGASIGINLANIAGAAGTFTVPGYNKNDNVTRIAAGGAPSYYGYHQFSNALTMGWYVWHAYGSFVPAAYVAAVAALKESNATIAAVCPT